MFKRFHRSFLLLSVVAVLTTALSVSAAAKLSGTVKIDGSSTVFPLTEAVAEEFNKVQPNVKVPVGVSGTGGGFKQFCAGEIAISDASRAIKKEEIAACKKKGITYLELAVAYDGITVVLNKENTWVDKLTLAELNAIFKKDSTVKTWADVRKGWPEEKIKIYSPGGDSGTFEFFTEKVNKKAKESRNDSQISFSEDDNVLVQGVSSDKYAIGYFGFVYYEENASKLRAALIDNGKATVGPSLKTIANATYFPLSRPLYIYVNKKELARPEVKEFAKFYLSNVGRLAKEVGYVPLSAGWYKVQASKIK